MSLAQSHLPERGVGEGEVVGEVREKEKKCVELGYDPSIIHNYSLYCSHHQQLVLHKYHLHCIGKSAPIRIVHHALICTVSPWRWSKMIHKPP